MDKRNIKFIKSVADNIRVKADPVLLEELLRNFIENSVKYTPVDGTIEICAVRENGHLKIYVKDTGVGLALEHIDRVFDEFFKVDGSRHDLSSSGLGLAICKRIAQLHHWEISAYSRGLGMGSEFSVDIPETLI